METTGIEPNFEVFFAKILTPKMVVSQQIVMNTMIESVKKSPYKQRKGKPGPSVWVSNFNPQVCFFCGYGAQISDRRVQERISMIL